MIFMIKVFLVPLFLLFFLANVTGQTTIILAVHQNPELIFEQVPADTTIIEEDSIFLGSQVLVSGGSGIYSYRWSPGKGMNDSTILNPKASPDSTTTYYLEVIDEGGCSIVAERKIFVKPLLRVAVEKNDNLCYGEKNGSVKLNITGGIPPYSFKWGTGDTALSLDGLPSGFYPYEARSTDEQVVRDSVKIGPDPFMISGFVLKDTMVGAKPRYLVDISVSGGLKPYSYLWTYNFTTEDILVPKRYGAYDVRVTDFNGCKTSQKIVVCDGCYVVENVSICQGSEYNGWKESGTYTRTFISVLGCDSVVTTTLNVLPKIETVEYISICQGGNYCGFDTAGVYQRKLVSIGGCDSIVTTHLVVNPVYEVSENITICQGENYQGWVESGVYKRKLPSVSGCDSLVTTQLTVSPMYDIIEHVAICDGEKYLGWDSTGVYMRKLVSVSGCDSIITTHLTVNIVYHRDENITICDGENYLGWNKTGQYERAQVSTSGCDSIITTHLTVAPVYNDTVNISICEGENYLGWSKAGIYKQSFHSGMGCDSIITIVLTINPILHSSEVITLCPGGKYLGWDKPGQYSRTLVSSSGCDSIVTTNLSFYPVEKPEIMVSGDTLTCTNYYQSYQWYLEGAKINDATSKQYIINKSGSYHLIVDDANGCNQTSGNKEVVYSSIQMVPIGDLNCTLFPNPNDGSFRFEIRGEMVEPVDILILDSTGKVVYQKEDISVDGFYSGSVKLKLPDGAYTFAIYKGSQKLTKQFIVR